MRSLIPGLSLFELIMICISIKILSGAISDMCKKTCPYCHERYNEGAVKCPHCQSDLTNAQEKVAEMKENYKPNPLMPGQIEWEKMHPEERIAREKREMEEKARLASKEEN